MVIVQVRECDPAPISKSLLSAAPTWHDADFIRKDPLNFIFNLEPELPNVLHQVLDQDPDQV